MKYDDSSSDDPMEAKDMHASLRSTKREAYYANNLSMATSCLLWIMPLAVIFFLIFLLTA